MRECLLRSHHMSRAAHVDGRPAGAGQKLFITGLGIGQICS
jgi:hypothetical protein